MILDKQTAKKTAELLMQVNAIKLQPDEPFTWASGWKSPIYCDNRVTLSHPAVRKYISDNMVKAIENNFDKPDVIAGVATGAIAIGMLVAEAMNLPFIYIRPEAKKHGRQNQIEGEFHEGQSVVVIEDLISTGMSSLKAVDALNNANAKVLGMIGIFTYGFKVADEAFAKSDVKLVTLSDYDHLLEQASDTKFISDNEVSLLSKWRVAPSEWNNKM